jgi:G3E family GTPase
MNNNLTTNSDLTEISLNTPKEQGLRVLAITGSLGSGKTTMLNSILGANSANLNRWIVIENDVGESNIDAVQLKAPSDSIKALTSGCVCCEDAESLKRELVTLKMSHQAMGVETVAIETTGIANPGEVKKVLKDLDLKHRVVVTVNVRDFAHDAKLGLLDGHIESADIVIITHWDHLFDLDKPPSDVEGILTHEDASQVLSEIQRRNKNSPIACMNRHGHILGGLDPLSVELKPKVQSNYIFNPVKTWDGLAENSHSHNSNKTTQSLALLPVTSTRHHPMVYARTIKPKDGLTAEALASALSDPDLKILRVKGFLGGELIHGVRSSFTIVPAAGARDSVVNIIALSPLPDEILTQIESAEEYQNTFTKRDADLQTAEQEVIKLLKHFPNPPVSRTGRLLVDYVGDKAYKYIEAEGFSKNLRLEFYRLSAETRLKALEIYSSQQLEAETNGTFWGQRLGSVSSWLLAYRSEELELLGLRDSLAKYNPATLYFSSMKNAKSDSEFPTLTPGWLEVLPGYADLLEREIGSSGARELLGQVFERMTGSSGPASWIEAKDKLAAFMVK